MYRLLIDWCCLIDRVRLDHDVVIVIEPLRVIFFTSFPIEEPRIGDAFKLLGGKLSFPGFRFENLLGVKFSRFQRQICVIFLVKNI